VYGENLKVTYKMGGQFESLQGWMEEYSVDERTTVDWISESIELTNMPVRPDYYLRTGVTSSYPACRAFKAAQLQSEGLAARYLRRMMEAFGLECRPATDDELIRLAEEVGLNGSQVKKTSTPKRSRRPLMQTWTRCTGAASTFSHSSSGAAMGRRSSRGRYSPPSRSR